MSLRPQEIVEFWFGEATTDPRACAERTKVWFMLDKSQQAAFDQQIRTRFGKDVEAALRGELDGWANDANGRLALVLLLDQFTRNIHRGTAQAFAGDAQAQRLVLQGCQDGVDRTLHPVERMFFYMPLEHAEDASLQNQSVEAFRALAANTGGELQKYFQEILPYAEQHREIISRFGRFPHRNAALGRASTAAEREYLASGASNFGQSSKGNA